MRGYSEVEVFPPGLRTLWVRASSMVDRVPQHYATEVRCHELARAVAILCDLPDACVQDGYYGFCEHTWLWTREPPAQPLTKRVGWPHILDVYSVGQLPMVRLVDGDHTGLPHTGWSYRPDARRSDIDEAMIRRLVADMGEAGL